MIIIQQQERRPLSNNSTHIIIPIGTSINELTIESLPFKTINRPRRIFYECSCTCGQITIADSSRLRTEAIKSCGCKMSTSNKRQTQRICKGCNKKESETKFARWGMLCRRCVRQKWPRRLSEYYGKSLENFVRYRLSSIRSKKKRQVDITLQDVCELYNKQNGQCALSGLLLSFKTHSPDALSIDRIDSTIGYVPNNIQLVCTCLNLAKNSFDNDTILAFLEKLKNGITLHPL